MARKNNPEIDDSNVTSEGSSEKEDRHRRILQQLKNILSNPEFYATEQQKNFLEFVVKESLAGRSDQLKGYTVATKVFGRAHDFDTQSDPIVSVQANRLRRALEHYYVVYGTNDPIVIEIPKGTYVPVFIERYTVNVDADKLEVYPGTDTFATWPALLILPFNNGTGDPDKNYLCMGIAAELAAEISYFQNMRVLFPRDGKVDGDKAKGFRDHRFELTGDVYKFGDELKITIHLEDKKSGRLLWGDTYVGSLDAIELVHFQENLVKIVAAKVSGDFGIVSRLVTAETRHIRTVQLNTYEAILRFYEYEQSFSPETFTRSMEALTIAVEKDPECGRLWSLLAMQYGTIHNLDIPGFDKPLRKATEFAERGASLEPTCQRAVGTLALIRLFNNELAIAIDEADRSLRMNPNSLFVLDGLAYILILSGDWNRGVALAEKAITFNPYHRAVLHDALWVNYLRVGKYNSAYHEAMYGRRPWLFWDPLIKGSTLGLLDQEREGREYAQKLLELRPDFPSHGRKLIRSYIKFDEIAELIELGLERVGIELH